MITHPNRVLLVLLMLLAATAASVADSAREMISAGRIDDAIAELNGRLSSVPADAESANLLCRAYFELEDWDRAESSCKKAAVLNPNDSHFHLWLGRVYGERATRTNFLVATSLAAKVRAEFERAVQLNPDDVDARLDLARFYVEAPTIMGGGVEKAREQAQAVATVNPGREHWIYARIAEQKKDSATAEREYHQYIDLSHGDADAWLNLALFLRRQNRLDDMELAVVKLSQSPMPKLDVLVEAAEMLYRAGRSYPFATELLHRYLASGPVEAAPAFKARYLRGLLLEKQGDKAGAAQEYRASLALVRNFGTAQHALDRVVH